MDYSTLRTELENILQDKAAAKTAVDTILHAAATVRSKIEPIASAYKIYLASGAAPYTEQELAKACQFHERCIESGLPSSLIDILYHRP